MRVVFFFFSSRRRHTRLQGDWSSDVCSSDLLQQPPFAALSHQGPKHGFFLATFTSDRGTLAVLAVYDLDVSSLGLVQLFYEQLAADLKAASPKTTVPKQVLAADFERELTDSLNTLFGR